MAWLVELLRAINQTLRLNKLELAHVCICESGDFQLNDFVDVDYLLSLSLSCLRFLHKQDLTLSRDQHLALAFRNGQVLDRARCISNWLAELLAEFLCRQRGITCLSVMNQIGGSDESVVRMPNT